MKMAERGWLPFSPTFMALSMTSMTSSDCTSRTCAPCPPPARSPDGLKKAYVRLTTDYDALDVANKIGII